MANGQRPGLNLVFGITNSIIPGYHKEEQPEDFLTVHKIGEPEQDFLVGNGKRHWVLYPILRKRQKGKWCDTENTVMVRKMKGQ